jgi:hypothetical protein
MTARMGSPELVQTFVIGIVYMLFQREDLLYVRTWWGEKLRIQILRHGLAVMRKIQASSKHKCGNSLFKYLTHSWCRMCEPIYALAP